jgi:hypothetical protein
MWALLAQITESLASVRLLMRDVIALMLPTSNGNKPSAHSVIVRALAASVVGAAFKCGVIARATSDDKHDGVSSATMQVLSTCVRRVVCVERECRQQIASAVLALLSDCESVLVAHAARDFFR